MCQQNNKRIINVSPLCFDYFSVAFLFCFCSKTNFDQSAPPEHFESIKQNETFEQPWAAVD